MGIVHSPHSSDITLHGKFPWQQQSHHLEQFCFPPLWIPVPKMENHHKDNWCRGAEAATTNCCFPSQLQSEWKPNHCWWKLPNSLFRNSSAHVLWGFFPFHWSQLWNYPIVKVPFIRAPRCFIKKLCGTTEKIHHSKTFWSLVADFSFQVYFLPEDEEKKQQTDSRKRPSCFQARFRSETKRTLRDPSSHEEHVATSKATHQLVSHEKPCRNRFYLGG